MESGAIIMDTDRDNKRVVILEEVETDITVGGHTTKATIIDLSIDGARIAYAGEPLKPDTKIGIISNNLYLARQSNVIWSRRLDDHVSMAGLQFNKRGQR